MGNQGYQEGAIALVLHSPQLTDMGGSFGVTGLAGSYGSLMPNDRIVGGTVSSVPEPATLSQFAFGLRVSTSRGGARSTERHAQMIMAANLSEPPTILLPEVLPIR